MKKIGLIILFFLFSLVKVNAQNYGIGHLTVTVTDASRSNRSIPLEIYYPADTSADNVPLSQDGVKFPVLSFGHGFVMAWSAYQNIWEAVVPAGYIIAFPKTETGFSPNHLEFGKDIAFAINYLLQEGSNSSSVFSNRIDSATCVMGHSMGGGASFLAVQYAPQVTAIANFAPAETNPSAIAAAAGVTIPALIFSGEKDCVTPPATNQIPMYNALSSSCKTIVQITGGIHCQMADANVLCNLGEASCLPSGTITVTDQHAIINRFLIPWLNEKLKNDCPSGILVDSLINNDNTVSVTNACVYCNITNSIVDLSGNLKVGPNPFHDSIVISGAVYATKEFVSLLSVDGKKVQSEITMTTDRIILHTSELAKGIYFLKIGNNQIKLLKN